MPTKALLGVVCTAPAGALVQLATEVALMAVLALLLIVTLSCPVERSSDGQVGNCEGYSVDGGARRRRAA